MSDNTEGDEQIIKVPSTTPKREKDPKRVAAGKKLAENNKRMREEYARYKASEAQRAAESPTETETEGNASGDGNDWLPKLSLTNVISLVGIGLTVYNIFSRSREKQPTPADRKHVDSEAWREPVSTTFEEPKVPKVAETRSKPKFGM